MFTDAQGTEITLGSYIHIATTKGLRIGRVIKKVEKLRYNNEVLTTMRVKVFVPNQPNKWRQSYETSLRRPSGVIVVPGTFIAETVKQVLG